MWTTNIMVYESRLPLSPDLLQLLRSCCREKSSLGEAGGEVKWKRVMTKQSTSIQEERIAQTRTFVKLSET